MMEIIMKQFKKKWLYVVLAGIIVAAGLVWEKSYNIQYAVKSGEIWDTQIITISNYSVFNSNTSESNSSTTNPFMYDKYMKAYPVISAFLSKTGNKFDYKKFDSNWDRYSENDSVHIYPEEQVISRRDIAIKYGIVGFILGGLVASTIIIITSVVTFYGRH